MNTFLSEHIGKICLVYIDDIVVFLQTREDRLQHVKTILDTIKAAGLALEGTKCQFEQQQVEL